MGIFLLKAVNFQSYVWSREIADCDSVVRQKSKKVVYFKIGARNGSEKVASLLLDRGVSYSIRLLVGLTV